MNVSWDMSEWKEHGVNKLVSVSVEEREGTTYAERLRSEELDVDDTAQQPRSCFVAATL